MWLKACLNGPRPPKDHSALPLTPGELAENGRSVVDAGAVALHIHPRGNDGKETLEAEAMGEALTALREACPGVPLEVSTAAWIEGNAACRLALVRAWRVLPDSAGVNFGEPGAIELAKTLLEMGIGVEAGLFCAEDARRLIGSGLGPYCLHVQIEPILAARADEALEVAKSIERVLDEGCISTPRLLHGKDATAWPMVEYAITRGYASRIGLEDTLLLPTGQTARDNTELVRAVLGLAAEILG